jgi:hypothetical protein
MTNSNSSQHPDTVCYHCDRPLPADARSQPWNKNRRLGPFFDTQRCRDIEIKRHVTIPRYEPVPPKNDNDYLNARRQQVLWRNEDLDKDALRNARDQLVAEYQRLLADYEASKLQAAQEEEQSRSALAARPIPDEPYRYEHTHILGPQGSGKTTLLQHIFLEDIKKSNPPAYIIIDPKGLLVERIAKLDVFNPATGRLRDRLIIIDPAQQPALNMFEQPIKTFSPDQASAVLNQLIEIFGYVFSSADSRLTQRQSIPFSFVVRLVFFMGGDINTLMDILDDDPKKRTFAQDIQRFAAQDPTGTVARFFNQDFYDTEFAGTRKQIKSRLYEILARPELARMFLASHNKLNLFECIQARKIVVVNTGLSYLGPSGSQLLGRYIIAMAMNAAFARYFIPKTQWNPVYLMCDEFQDFADAINTPKLLRLVREYNMGVIMAHQSMYAPELDDTLRTSISTSGVKYAASPEGMDLSYMCRDLRCEKDFLSAQQVNATHVNFACYVRGLGLQHPFTVAIEKGNIDREPQMPPAAYQQLLAANRRRLTAPLKSAPAAQPVQAAEPVPAPQPPKPTKPAATPPPDPSESGSTW